MKKLLAGPWLGEFGWEICAWTPYIRFISDNYEKTVVVCRKQNAFLYDDFADSFEFFDKKGKPDRWLLNGKLVEMPTTIRAKYPNCTVKTPNEARCMNAKKRKYFKYGTAKPECAYDLVVHARACTKYGQDKWNWPVKLYEAVLESLRPKRACSTGTVASHISGTEDLRGIPLKDLCNVFASSRVMLSPSSGPGHLASLCGCPHVIMTSNAWQKQIRGTNKDRYKTIWNPFNTPCKVLDKHDWHPPVDKVVKAVGKFL